MKYVIKVAPEITIKSKPVRKRTVRMLEKNIKIHLDDFDGFFSIRSFWDRIDIDFVDLPGMDAQLVDILKNIPGIYSFTEVECFDLPSDEKEVFDFILEKVANYWALKISGKTFVVRVNRSGVHEFRSIDLEKHIGGRLLSLSKDAKVNLHYPDVTVSLDVRQDRVYLVKNVFDGLGGYPTGFQERVLSLISGGFDSGVASFSLMKRGCLVDYLFFNLGGDAHELGVKQVSHYLWSRFGVSYKQARFITVDFEEIVKEIVTKVHHKFRAIILKRCMLKVASLIAEVRYYALIKGDSLGQVSSQTLKNMYVIDKAASTLVLRPLITFDKQEIVDISRTIGTYDFACNMPEYCGVVSQKPSTGADEGRVIEEEKNICESLLQEAFENRKTEFLKDMIQKYFSSQEQNDGIEVVESVGQNGVIIDIRDEQEVKRFPLVVGKGVEVLCIPFFEVKHKFGELDASKNYFLYCGKGMMSRLYALYLKERGYENIGIFQRKRG